MKDPETVKKLCASTFQIVDHHTKLGERGIILAPSFNIVQSVAETLRRMGGNYKVFEHVRGEKLADWLNPFKEYCDGPAVLLTPSGFEGIDLAGNLSRYQIIVKCPYGSLGDKRVKFILDTFSDVYQIMACMKIVQGSGRSVRAMDDHAVTYMLDTAAQRLWASSINEWKDEFSATYASQLGEN